MKLEVARAYARTLLAAVDKAEAEGRDTLTTADMDQFAALDDAARADLQAAIERHRDSPIDN
jgi:hypothetical protein